MAAIDALRRRRACFNLGALAQCKTDGIGIAAGDSPAGVDDRRFARVRRAGKAPAQAPRLEQPRRLGARPHAREGRPSLCASPLPAG